MLNFFNKNQFSEMGLIGCNMVIECGKIIHTGTITYVEGDSIEIQLPQYKDFKLGDEVKAIIYTPDGMISMHTSVIAKDIGAIVLIIPTKLDNLLNKRKFPRVETKIPGCIYSITDASLKNTRDFTQPEPIFISNVSLGGIGFISDTLSIKDKSVLFLEMTFDQPILTTYEAIHVKKLEQGMYIGCRFTDLSIENSNTLRAFILKTQIEARFEMKRKELS